MPPEKNGADRNHDRHPRNTPQPEVEGTWIIARTPISEPYPCRCGERQQFCPCVGRVDLDNVPEECCAHTGGRRRAAAA